MAHNHSHNHLENKSASNIKTAFFLNIFFTVLEIFGGIWTNSTAILSDALHDLGDSLSLGLAWFLQNKSKQKSNEKFTFGYRRFSLLGALINGIVLVTGSLLILSQAVPRLFNPEHANAEGMLYFAIGGIIINGAAVLKLKSGKTMNERVVTWHLLEDVLGWIAVLIVSIVLLVKDIHILDPILSILITLYVLFNVIKNLRKTFLIFLQGVPEEISIKGIENKIKSIAKVKSTHHAHIWSQDGEHHVLSIHVVVENVKDLKEVLEIKSEIRNSFKDISIEHVTIEMELEDEDCYMKEEC